MGQLTHYPVAGARSAVPGPGPMALGSTPCRSLSTSPSAPRWAGPRIVSLASSAVPSSAASWPRRFAVKEAADAIELGAQIFVLWGGREGCEVDAAKPVGAALDRYAEAVNLLCDYAIEQGYQLRIALEPKANEPRGDLLLPTVGNAR